MGERGRVLCTAKQAVITRGQNSGRARTCRQNKQAERFLLQAGLLTPRARRDTCDARCTPACKHSSRTALYI
ncbi:unnamed protein product, partial [Onchocerca flexuosa]|uniref:DUF1534 domain-containing protein n=1 Tax=Onchocerca flexuosa TaxID=387005 RepID=A0A183H3H8_9BILA